MSIWHSNQESPDEDRRVYIRKEGDEIFVGVFNCRYLGNFEMQTLDYEDDVTIPVEEIVKWAYTEDLEDID